MVFQPRVSLCILVCPGTHFVDKTGLRLTEIHLPLAPSAGIKSMHWTLFFLKQSLKKLSPFPPAPARAAGYISGRHRWRALWLSRKWQAQTRREAGKSDAHSLTKCRHAGRTMKTIRTAENFQKPHGGDLVPSSGDREDIRDFGSCAPETYPRHGSSS